MKFSEYTYRRPNLEKIEKSLKSIKERFKVATSASEQEILIDMVNVIRNSFETMSTLCSIRNSINTVDEFYETEREWFDQNSPVYESYINEITQLMLASKFRSELEAKYGSQLFKLLEANVKVFNPIIIEDLQLENQLTTQYQKLKASAKIEFDGKINNLAQMTPYAISPDRTIRAEAEKKVSEFYAAHEQEFDEIYDKLVKVRTTIAHKLGYKSFVEVGYLRMTRTDYNKDDVANYRKQVLNDLVPVVKKLNNERAKRLGLEELKSYDLALSFKDGNPSPFGTTEEKVAQAQKMYSEMSEETKEFFDFMVDHQLLDLDAKPSKALGGYCTVIPDYKSPFIFSNFNGTSGDVDVLTHEAGHAFQVYTTLKHQTILEYMFPTYEACEIHSMSMEFFAWPWMELFFKEDTSKYYYHHLAESICFIPYGVTVDEFQHVVYENPDMTPAERKLKWREIEQIYMPYKTYDDEFLNRGGFWFKQGHIFESPFYYIDYTLAQICAHQFWIKNHQDPKQAWSDYYNLCLEGGSKSFLNLLEVAHLDNPFVDGTIKKTVEPLEKFLEDLSKTIK